MAYQLKLKQWIPLALYAFCLVACDAPLQTSSTAQSASASKSASAVHLTTPLLSSSQPDAPIETVLIGSELSFPPFEFKDKQGQAIGFEVELLQEIAKVENFSIQFLPIERDNFIKELNSKQYRIIASAIAINAERSSQVDFSDAILDYDREIYFLDTPKNAHIKTIADFQGKTLAVNRSFNTATDITGSPQLIIKTKTFFLALKSMYTGKADGTLGDSRVLEYFSKQNPEIKTRKISLGEKKRELAFAVQKGDKAMLDKLNKGLATVKANGTYQKLIEKWF